MVFFKNRAILLFLSFIIVSCTDTPTDPGNQDVQIFFKYNYLNELNTFDNTYQKDLIQDGVIKVKFSLTKKEHEQILHRAEELGFFSLPDTLKVSPEKENPYFEVEPVEQLRIKSSSSDHKVVWHYYVLETEPQYVRLKEFRAFIISIIESKPQYMWLPASSGGYM